VKRALQYPSGTGRERNRGNRGGGKKGNERGILGLTKSLANVSDFILIGTEVDQQPVPFKSNEKGGDKNGGTIIRKHVTKGNFNRAES